MRRSWPNDDGIFGGISSLHADHFLPFIIT
jgi:hypothetical protein